MTNTLLEPLEPIVEDAQKLELLIEESPLLGFPLQPTSLEEFCLHPPEGTEYVDGEIIEKTGMGIFHGRVQVEFGALLITFLRANQLPGIVCTEVLCRTQKQARRPDVAYMSAQQVEDYGQTDFTILPECFPLVAEVVSPTDAAEDVFAKAAEYLESGAEEVWLLFPRNHLIMIATVEEISPEFTETPEETPETRVKWSIFANHDRALSPKVLSGFSVAIEELLPF